MLVEVIQKYGKNLHSFSSQFSDSTLQEIVKHLKLLQQEFKKTSAPENKFLKEVITLNLGYLSKKENWTFNAVYNLLDYEVQNHYSSFSLKTLTQAPEK